MSTELREHVRVSIRELKKDDMEAVIKIESLSYDHPMTALQFNRKIKRRNMLTYVSVSEGKTIGFAIVEAFKDHYNLVDLAIHPDFRRCDVGTKLFSYFVDKLHPTKRLKLTTTVRETNLTGQLFFKACGMRATSVLRHHYQDTDEDGYKMELAPKPKGRRKKAS